MSTIGSLSNGKVFIAVKGAPETIKSMLATVPDYYDETYKRFTREGSRVLALGYREVESMSAEKVSYMSSCSASSYSSVARSIKFLGMTLKHRSTSSDSLYSTVLSRRTQSKPYKC